MNYFAKCILLLALGIAIASADWCGYQQEPDRDPQVAMQISWKACGEPIFPGPYATEQVRDAYVQEKGERYMFLANFFNEGMKTCYYNAHDGANADQVDICNASYKMLSDQQGPQE